MRENRSGYSGSGQTGGWLVHSTCFPPEYGAMNRVADHCFFRAKVPKHALGASFGTRLEWAAGLI